MKLGEVVTSESGQRFMYVGSTGYNGVTMPSFVGLLLCRIPDGMTEYDYGRKFTHDSTQMDPTAWRLIDGRSG